MSDKKQICKNCKWWRRVVNVLRHGQCCYNPPNDKNKLPVTDEEHFCSKFKYKRW